MIPDRIRTGGVVQISTVSPARNLDGNLWYNPTAGTLFVSVNGTWTAVGGGGGGGGLAEVHVGPTAPVGTEVIWIDTSATEIAARYLLSAGVWATALDSGRY